MTDPEDHARRLAQESLAAYDPTAWFEQLYAQAHLGEAEVPWQRGEPYPALVTWATEHTLNRQGKRAVVVGCGLGDDAEYLADLGFNTVAFDVSKSAIDSARQRFPDSTVDYRTVDLLTPPADLKNAFDLVVEIRTVHSLPRAFRATATANIRQMDRERGTLLVITAALAAGADPDD